MGISWKKITWLLSVLHYLFLERMEASEGSVGRNRVLVVQGSLGLKNKICMQDLHDHSSHFRFRNCLGFNRIVEEEEGKLQRVYILVCHFKALLCFPIYLTEIFQKCSCLGLHTNSQHDEQCVISK